MRILPVTENIGAEIHVSPELSIAGDHPERILEALNQYNVLIFPQIGMTDDAFLALTAALGEQHDNAVTNDGTAVSQKGIFRIALGKDDKTQQEFIRANDYWHMDGMSYDVPVKATLLKCESAAREGGDTGFANLHAAFAALPEDERRQLAGLKVGHRLAASLSKLYDAPSPDDYARWDAIFPRLEHPLVWEQQNGKSSLLIGSTANDILGMSYLDSRSLLDGLLEWCTQDCFTYRHQWRRGDLVIFNNPGLLHKSYPYDHAAGRIMHRTTLKGREAISEASPTHLPQY